MTERIIVMGTGVFLRLCSARRCSRVLSCRSVTT
eukprot:XP_001707133.1 Hypothetical protein GL50803_99548 [Giardia lamblia ATCC 50803]